MSTFLLYQSASKPAYHFCFVNIDAINKSKTPIPAIFHTSRFKSICKPKSQRLLMTLKCPEKIGNRPNQANNIQYAMNKRSNSHQIRAVTYICIRLFLKLLVTLFHFLNPMYINHPSYPFGYLISIIGRSPDFVIFTRIIC